MYGNTTTLPLQPLSVPQNLSPFLRACIVQSRKKKTRLLRRRVPPCRAQVMSSRPARHRVSLSTRRSFIRPTHHPQQGVQPMPLSSRGCLQSFRRTTFSPCNSCRRVEGRTSFCRPTLPQAIWPNPPLDLSFLKFPQAILSMCPRLRCNTAPVLVRITSNNSNSGTSNWLSLVAPPPFRGSWLLPPFCNPGRKRGCELRLPQPQTTDL